MEFFLSEIYKRHSKTNDIQSSVTLAVLQNTLWSSCWSINSVEVGTVAPSEKLSKQSELATDSEICILARETVFCQCVQVARETVFFVVHAGGSGNSVWVLRAGDLKTESRAGCS